MQETRNSCSGSKKRKTTLHQTNSTGAYLFSPDEGLFYVFSNRNICSELLASVGVTLHSDYQSHFKTPFCGASVW